MEEGGGSCHEVTKLNFGNTCFTEYTSIMIHRRVSHDSWAVKMANRGCEVLEVGFPRVLEQGVRKKKKSKYFGDILH